MGIIVSLLLEIIVNKSSVREALSLCTDIPLEEIPHFMDDSNMNIYDKAKQVIGFVGNHRKEFGISERDYDNVKSIDIQELVDVLDHMNQESNTWTSESDVYHTLRLLNILPDDFSPINCTDSVSLANGITDNGDLMDKFRKGLNIGLKEIPIAYRAIVKSKILKLIK